MSYDLMVFDPISSPYEREDFMKWYREQICWNEDHDYTDPKVTTASLRNWFQEMKQYFPSMNSVLEIDGGNESNPADYSIGKKFIYAGFSSEDAEFAKEVMKRLAIKNHVGFFDASSSQGEIIFPDKPICEEEIVQPKSINQKKEKFENITRLAKSILDNKGLKNRSTAGGRVWLYRELSENRLCFDYSIKNKRAGVFLQCSCTFVSNEIGEAINYIDRKKHRVFPGAGVNSIQWGAKEVTEETIEGVIDGVSCEALDFSNGSSYTMHLDDLLSTLNRPGSHQLWHIAALSATNNIERLELLLDGLRNKSDRGGLFSYINEDCLERAIDHARRKFA